MAVRNGGVLTFGFHAIQGTLVKLPHVDVVAEHVEGDAEIGGIVGSRSDRKRVLEFLAILGRGVSGEATPSHDVPEVLGGAGLRSQELAEVLVETPAFELHRNGVVGKTGDVVIYAEVYAFRQVAVMRLDRAERCETTVAVLGCTTKSSVR